MSRLVPAAAVLEVLKDLAAAEADAARAELVAAPLDERNWSKVDRLHHAEMWLWDKLTEARNREAAHAAR